MKNLCTLLLILSLLISTPTYADEAEPAVSFESLPPLPVAVSGQFAGVLKGVLVVAGGTSFSAPPWEGGTKFWHNKIYRLYDEQPARWFTVDTLAAPRAYGGSATHGTGVYMVGGSNGRHHYDDVMLLSELEGEMGISVLPERLPASSAYMGTALLGDTLYVCGGQESPESGVATNALWSLDLVDANAKWQVLEPLPGAPRVLPAMAALGGSLYVAGGASLGKGDDGKETRTYLQDAWKFTPGKGWKAVAGLPGPLAAAPNAALGSTHWMLIGGDTGENFAKNAELKDQHPGFSHDVLVYTPALDSWSKVGESGEALVATTATPYRDGIAVAGGEDKPGHRSANGYVAKVAVQRNTLASLDWAGIGIYLAGMLGIGFYFSARENSAKQFFLGGGRIPWWAVGLSIFGTAISSITYLSIPARAFATDWTMTLASIAGVFVAPLVVYFYIPRFRRMNISTAYEYLEQRFGFVVRVYGSLCFLLFQFGRISVVMFLPALALSETSGMSTTTSILLMGGLTTVYTVLGGIEAVIWTDVVQSVVLVGGAVLALVLIVGQVDGGLGEILTSGMAAGKFDVVSTSWSYVDDALWVILLGNIFANFYPSTADQTIVQRYLTTKDEQAAARATWTNAALTIPTTILFFSLGTALWAYFRQHPLTLPPNMRNDAVLPVFMMAEFPAGARGILISGVFAAAMSSLSSSMNSIASVAINDYYKRFLNPAVSELHALRIAQGITLLLGVAGTASSLYIAKVQAVSLWDPFLKLLGLAGGGLAGLFALGIFFSRANGTGAVIGALASMAVLYVVVNYTAANAQLYGMVGFLTALGVGALASILLPQRGAQVAQA